MIEVQKAQSFAERWIQAWNDRDLDAIMDFYSDSIHHITPMLMMLFGADSNIIQDKQALRNYFEASLERVPNLHFELREVFSGDDSIVIIIQSNLRIKAAVTMTLDENMKITRYIAHFRD